MNEEGILRTDGLSKQFGGVRALQEVNMVVPEGAIFGIIGPNGSGKTTFFNVVTGFNAPTAGRIQFKGRDIAGLPIEKVVRHGIARTFQNPRLFGDLSVTENVLIGMHLRLRSGVFSAIARDGRSRNDENEGRSKAMEILKFVGMDRLHKEEASSLPYGMQKKLEIARGLASMPDLLLLDEPAAGMNPDEVGDLSETIMRIQEKGITVVVIEHNMRLIMNIAKTIMVLSFGKIIAQGLPKEIQEDPAVIQAYLGTKKGADSACQPS